MYKDIYITLTTPGVETISCPYKFVLPHMKKKQCVFNKAELYIPSLPTNDLEAETHDGSFPQPRHKHSQVQHRSLHLATVFCSWSPGNTTEIACFLVV